MVFRTDIRRYRFDRRPKPFDPREAKYALIPSSAPDRSTVRSLAQFFGPVKDQGQEGSCTANSGTLIQEACGRISGQQVQPLSRMELYRDERVDEGTWPQDAGAYVSDSFDSALRRGGLILESVWPYDAAAAENPPAGAEQTPRSLWIKGHQPIPGNAFIDGILTALDAGQPLAVGMVWYNSFYADYQNTGILGSPSGGVAGGHQISVKGWIPSAGLVWCQNSWGATSPARIELHPDAKQGDAFLPIERFTDGTVDEVRAAVPLSVQPQPSPTAPLVASAGGPYQGQSGQPIQFSGQATGGVPPYADWKWLANGQVIGSGQLFTLPAAASAGLAGQWKIELELRDSGGSSGSSITTLTITAAPQPTPPGPDLHTAIAAIRNGRSQLDAALRALGVS